MALSQTIIIVIIVVVAVILITAISLGIYFGTKSSSSDSPHPSPVPPPVPPGPTEENGSLPTDLIQVLRSATQVVEYAEPFSATPDLTLTTITPSVINTSLLFETGQGFTTQSTFPESIVEVNSTTFFSPSLPMPVLHVPGTAIILSVRVTASTVAADTTVIVQRSTDNGKTWDNNNVPAFDYSEAAGFVGGHTGSISALMTMQKNASGTEVPKIIVFYAINNNNLANNEYAPVVILEATTPEGVAWTATSISVLPNVLGTRASIVVSDNDVMSIVLQARVSVSDSTSTTVSLKYLPDNTSSPLSASILTGSLSGTSNLSQNTDGTLLFLLSDGTTMNIATCPAVTNDTTAQTWNMATSETIPIYAYASYSSKENGQGVYYMQVNFPSYRIFDISSDGTLNSPTTLAGPPFVNQYRWPTLHKYDDGTFILTCTFVLTLGNDTGVAVGTSQGPNEQATWEILPTLSGLTTPYAATKTVDPTSGQYNIMLTSDSGAAVQQCVAIAARVNMLYAAVRAP